MPHCEDCDPQHAAREVRQLQNISAARLMLHAARLLAEASRQTDPAERQHDLMRAALCKVAAERHPDNTKRRQRR